MNSRSTPMTEGSCPSTKNAESSHKKLSLPLMIRSIISGKPFYIPKKDRGTILCLLQFLSKTESRPLSCTVL